MTPVRTLHVVGLVCAALSLAACADSDGGKGSPLTRPPFEPEPPGAPGVGGGEQPEPQAAAPIAVPPFGPGTVPLVRRYLERVAEACGGSMCVEIAYSGVPSGVDLAEASCFVDSVSPRDVVDRGAVLTLDVSCPPEPAPGGDGEPGEDGGEVPPEEDGDEVVPPEDDGEGSG